MDQAITHIVIEGGPAGGKSSGITAIRDHFRQKGYLVLVSREVPTWLCDEHGYDLSEEGRNISNEDFQRLVLQHVIEQEERLRRRACESNHAKVLILSDRGRFGGAAYMEREAFFKMAREEFGQHLKDLYHYDGCVFLQSLAVDQPEKYLEVMRNNSARRELHPEAGVTQNNHSLKSCVGVSRMAIIDNSTDFQGKLARTIRTIEHFLSETEHERKFTSTKGLVLSKEEVEVIFRSKDVHFVPAAISQAYLLLDAKDKQEKIKAKRVRSLRLGSESEPESFYFTRKGPKVAGGGQEFEMSLSESEYSHYLANEADPNRNLVVKTRFYFVDNGWYWELDIFTSPSWQRFILEVEHLPEDDVSKITPPAWLLGDLVDVTDDPKFSNQVIAQKA